ncbi:MAG: amidohydrolase family protein, partial [Brevibacterium aurantiacum]
MQLFTGISELVVNDLDNVGELNVIEDAALLIDDGRVVWSGPSAQADTVLRDHLGEARSETSTGTVLKDDDITNGEVTSASAGVEFETIDLGGKAVIPGFVDSHNHLVFAGDRSAEFAARMAGQKYSAGGIATTVAATRAASEEELEANLVHLLGQATRQGTTTFEIKSGYGLTLADELQALRIINRHTEESTLIAAHVVPPEYKDNPEAYVDLVINEIIPAATGQA